MSTPTLTPYLTTIPDRSPSQKAHTSLGQAKKAVSYRLHGGELAVVCIIHEWVDSKGWVVKWRIPAGTKGEDLPWR